MRRRATTRRLRRTMLAGVALFAVAMVVLLDATNAFDRAELSTVDTRFGLRGERPVPKDVVVVGIDDVTFDELKERWVFSRLTFARALRGITRDKPKAVAYDVEFVESTGDRPEDIEADNALVLASRSARNVVFSATAVSRQGTTNIFGGLEGQKFGRAGSATGCCPRAPAACCGASRTRSTA